MRKDDITYKNCKRWAIKNLSASKGYKKYRGKSNRKGKRGMVKMKNS